MNGMKTIGMAVLVLVLAGCTEKTVYVTAPDTQPPAAPRGVRTTTGDGQVWIDWFANEETDLAGYLVWKSTVSDTGPYARIGDVRTTSFLDNNVINGNTYFYAVSAYDRTGNESPLSPNSAFDTPRPEGAAFVRDFNTRPDSAGFNFFNSPPYGSVVAWNNSAADIYLEYSIVDAAWFINCANIYTDIQDMGYTSNFDEISYVPDSTYGWSRVGWTEAIFGHTYIIRTADDHYAKIRIYSIGNPTSSGVSFDWGYQLATSGLGHLELKPVVPPQRDPATYLRRPVTR